MSVTVGPDTLRAAMSRFATGVVVLTVGGDSVHGMTANAFSSVSLTPPMVLCCVARTAVMHEALSAAGTFAVSIVRAEQAGLARYFADKRRPLGPEQFAGIDWRPGPCTGAPLLAGALAWLECELTDAHAAGDHSVFVGAVLAAEQGPGGDALLVFDGATGAAGPPR
jgi:flavin reductase